MPSVQVVGRPSGEAPEWVRDAWIGCVLPLSEVLEMALLPTVGVLSGKRVHSENDGGYRIDSDAAVQILREEHPEAAQWWVNQGFGFPGRVLVFGKQFCELLPS